MISHGSYHHQGRRGSDRPVVFWLKFTGSVAPRMGVAAPLRRPTASRGRKRPRAAARLVGSSRAACCRSRLRANPFLFWFVSFWLLFSGVWETLIFGTGDWFAFGFGEPFFCGLFTPTNPLPGHRLVPESHIYIYIYIICAYTCVYIYIWCACLEWRSMGLQED